MEVFWQLPKESLCTLRSKKSRNKFTWAWMVGRRLQSVAKRHVRRDGCLSTRLLMKLKAKVKASHEDLDFILLCWSELADDATADALLKKLRSPDWIAALYILTDVLPVLLLLSRTFQQGSINFSQIQPSTEITVTSLQAIPERNKTFSCLKSDFGGSGIFHFFSADISVYWKSSWKNKHNASQVCDQTGGNHPQQILQCLLYLHSRYSISCSFLQKSQKNGLIVDWQTLRHLHNIFPTQQDVWSGRSRVPSA